MRRLVATAVLSGILGAPAPADTPLTTCHPSYDLHNLRPDNFPVRVGGMDFLPDGRLAIADWGGDMTATGKVYLVSGVAGTDRTRVTFREFAGKLKEPLGIKAVGDTLYVLCKNGLFRLPDRDGDGVADTVQLAAGGWSYPPKPGGGERYHLFSLGLAYRDGFFYAGLGGEYPPSATQGKDRGSLIRMNPRTGGFEILAGGLRTPNGIVFGPDGEIFGSENQGHWMPSDKLNNIRPGRNYGMHNDPSHPLDISKVPASPPAVWIDHGNIGISPSEPAYVTQGPYAGQLLIGDVAYGGLQRIFLEKVDGEWQGAIFRFAGGFEAGINRLAWGPDGALYVGQIGNGGTAWGWRDKRYGLSKLVLNGRKAFEILAVRSRRNGLELEFTEPVAASAADVSKYKVTTWRNVSQEEYGGGNRMSITPLVPKAARLSGDGRRVFLELDGLTPTWVVQIQASVTSDSGKTPWANEAFYTLNRISASAAFDPVTPVDARLSAPETLASGFRLQARRGEWVVDVPFRDAHRLALLRIGGAVVSEVTGSGPGQRRFPNLGLSRGAYLIVATVGSRRFVLPASRL